MIVHRYSIAARIGVVVGVILVMMLVLAYVEVQGLNSIRTSLDDLVGKHYQRLQVAQDLRFSARHSAVLVRNVLLVADEQAKRSERQRFEESVERYNMLLGQLTAQERNEEEENIIQAILEGGEITFSLWRAVLDDERVGVDAQKMDMLQAEVRSHQWGLLDNLDHLVSLEKKLAEKTMANARQNYQKTKSVMAMVNILAIGAGLFSVAVITASIVGPLREISRKVDAIASGDLTTRIELDQQDEVGQLALHINRMVEKLETNEAELEEYRYHLEELIELRTGEVNDQRERFISVLIHDLKGPLVPIVGFSRLLMNKPDLDKDKTARYIREIYESTAKLATVIEKTSRDLRKKQMSLSFDKEPFDIEELLYYVSRNCLPELRRSDIQLRLNDQHVEEFESTGEILYAGDIAKIRSLFENLLGNASKYAVSSIDVQLKKQDEVVQVTIDDDGCGVAKPFRKKIFEEYYQAPGSEDGTGVGLYSVKRIVEHYQGNIDVCSSPAGGARFTITLPLS